MGGKTVGVFGTGAIGVEAARIFKGIGMNVLAYDVKPNPAVRCGGWGVVGCGCSAVGGLGRGGVLWILGGFQIERHVVELRVERTRINANDTPQNAPITG